MWWSALDDLHGAYNLRTDRCEQFAKYWHSREQAGLVRCVWEGTHVVWWTSADSDIVTRRDWRVWKLNEALQVWDAVGLGRRRRGNC